MRAKPHQDDPQGFYEAFKAEVVQFHDLCQVVATHFPNFSNIKDLTELTENMLYMAECRYKANHPDSPNSSDAVEFVLTPHQIDSLAIKMAEIVKEKEASDEAA